MNLVERLHQRRAQHAEKGMASLMYILLILVVCASLGLGVDSAIGNFTSNGLRSIADMSVMDASSKTKLVGNTRSIVKADAEQRFKLRYLEARKDYPNVTGKNPEGPKKLTFQYVRTSSGVYKEMTANVKEESHTRFLALVGIDQFEHNVSATARLGALYEKR